MKTQFAHALILAVIATHVPTSRAQSMQATMKAAVLPEHGGPDNFEIQTVPQPSPKEDEVLVRVMAAGVNPVDAYVREGMSGEAGSDAGKMIIGSDIAGVVEKIGGKIMKFKPGDAIYAYLPVSRGGAYAEFAIAKEGEMAIKPKNIDFVKAAAVPLAATTAWQALVDTAKIRKGQRVLIHGGSGGVGSFAVQIAKARGCKVIATASTANQDLLKQLRVGQSIDYSKTRFQSAVKDVDVVLNCVGADTLRDSYGIVKRGGTIVSITTEPDTAECASHGLTCARIMAHPDAMVLEEMTRLIEANAVSPIVSQTFPLSDVAQAHRQIESRHTRGKIILKIGHDNGR